MSVTPAGKVTEVQRLSEVDSRLGEGGLLGIAVSPTYAEDGWVYVYYSAAEDNRIARLKLGRPPEPILTGIPVSGDESRYHQGGRLAFGPDGMLYASVGETYFDSEIAQDTASLGGKILRMTGDGGPPPATRSPFHCGPHSPLYPTPHQTRVRFTPWARRMSRVRVSGGPPLPPETAQAGVGRERPPKPRPPLPPPRAKPKPPPRSACTQCPTPARRRGGADRLR